MLDKQRTKFIYNHRAPACFSCGTSLPLMWAAMTWSRPPNNFPPTNTAGTGCELPSSRISAFARSAPQLSSSSSYTVGPTPKSQNKRFTTWHIQHPLWLNTTTAFAAASLWILSMSTRESRCSASLVVLSQLQLQLLYWLLIRLDTNIWFWIATSAS